VSHLKPFIGRYAAPELDDKGLDPPIFSDDKKSRARMGMNHPQLAAPNFTVGNTLRTITLPSRITVTNSESYGALARLGFGLIQAPRHRYEDDLAQGTLVEVLPAHPPSPLPISVLYPKSRQLSPRVRVFIDWLVEILAPKF